MRGLPGCCLHVSVALVLLLAGYAFGQTRQDGESPKQKERTTQQLKALAAIQDFRGGEVRLAGENPGAPLVSVKLICKRLEDRPTLRTLLSLLALFPELQSVDLVGDCIFDEDLRHLPVLPGLRKVWICNAPITDDGVKHLAKLPELCVLCLALCDRLTDKSLAHIQQCKRLEQLDLDSVRRITDNELQRLRSLPHLRHLRLYRNPITDKGVKVLSTLPNLEELELGLTKITDDGLPHLIAAPKLRELNVESEVLTSDALKAFQRARPDVKLFREAE